MGVPQGSQLPDVLFPDVTISNVVPYFIDLTLLPLENLVENLMFSNNLQNILKSLVILTKLHELSKQSSYNNHLRSSNCKYFLYPIYFNFYKTNKLHLRAINFHITMINNRLENSTTENYYKNHNKLG